MYLSLSFCNAIDIPPLLDDCRESVLPCEGTEAQAALSWLGGLGTDAREFRANCKPPSCSCRASGVTPFSLLIPNDLV